MFKTILIGIVFTGCVTTGEKKKNVYQFPNSFKTEQIVKVFDGSKEFSVLGTTTRTGSDFTFEFAEPFLLTKLVTAKVRNGETDIQWNTGYRPNQFDAQRVVDTLVKLYQSEVSSQDDGLYIFETSPVRFELSNLEGAEPCRFPSRIRATSPMKEDAWITFDTRSSNC